MGRDHEIAVVGSGSEAEEHLLALQTFSNISVVAIYGTNTQKIQQLAKLYHIKQVFSSLGILIEQKPAKYVHLFEPISQRYQVALALLESGFHIFSALPLAETAGQLKHLIELAHQQKACFGGDWYCLHHPTLIKYNNILRKKQLANPNHVLAYWSTQLPELTYQQFRHWILQKPINVLLKYAWHPLSTISYLLGKIYTVDSIPTEKIEPRPGQLVVKCWSFSLVCEKGTAQLFLSIDQSYPVKKMDVIFDNGQVQLDFEHNICGVRKSNSWESPYHNFFQNISFTYSYKLQNWQNLFYGFCHHFGLLKGYNSLMKARRESLYHFYQNPTKQQKQNKLAVRLLEICQITATSTEMEPMEPRVLPQFYDTKEYHQFDVIIFGGTGFIGQQVVKKMLQAGKKILVVARHATFLDKIFHNPQLTFEQADIMDQKRIFDLVETAPIIILLAPNANPWNEVLANTTIQGIQNVAKACLHHQSQKLVYLSSILTLDTGNPKEILDGRSEIDPKIGVRSLESQSRAEVEEQINDLLQRKQLPVCILRAGFIVGAGHALFSANIGHFPCKNYCLGWNKGINPLPFVLVEDVAEAICLAAFSEQVTGHTYNLIGDVHFTAKEYIQELSNATKKDIRYLPQAPIKQYIKQLFHNLAISLVQRRRPLLPSFHSIKAKGMMANFDCTDTKQDLGWQPENNKDIFMKKIF